MKKILKIIFTILFLIGLAFEIFKLISNYSDSVLLPITLSIFLFLVHLFAWIAPKTLFNLCWNISKDVSVDFDYDTSYSKIESVGLGILIASIIFLIISILLTI